MVLDVPTVEIRCRKFHETELGEEGHETDGYFSVASFRIRATPQTPSLLTNLGRPSMSQGIQAKLMGKP